MSREKRGAWRIEEQSTAIVTIVSSVPDQPDLIGKKFFCRTTDISTTGLRLAGDAGMPLGTQTEILLAMKSQPKAFALRGTVRWVKVVAPPNPYLIGIKLDPQGSKDMKSWEAFVKEKLPPNALKELKREFSKGEDANWR